MLKPQHIVKLSRSGSVAPGGPAAAGRMARRPEVPAADADGVLRLAIGLRRLCELAYAPTPDILAIAVDALVAARLAQRERALTVEAAAQLALSLSHLGALLSRARSTSPERDSLLAQAAAFWEDVCHPADRADGAALAKRLGELGRLHPALRKALARAELSGLPTGSLSGSGASPLGSIGLEGGRDIGAAVAPAAIISGKLPAARRNPARTRAA